MYKIAIRGWLKHLDFIILDLFSLFIALELSFQITEAAGKPFLDPNKSSFAVMLLMIDFMVIIIFDSFERVVTRGYATEIFRTVRHGLLLLAFTFFAVAIRNADVTYPRFMQIWAGVLYFLISYSTRVIWKNELRRRSDESKEPKRTILIVTDSAYSHEILKRVRGYDFIRFNLVGLVLSDRDARGESIEDVPVVANLDDAADFICHNWIDDVFFFHASQTPAVQKLMAQCREMAMTIHIFVGIEGIDESKQMINYLGGYEVLTASINMMNPRDVFLKRSFDVIVGFFGSIAAVFLLIILGPFIYAASPGPLIFCQERIGENGKRFKMYKIRSMYPDAEQRKKALAEQSTHTDGMMFKMNFDPRVIGNRILPDGTQKKGIGAFIRDTSLDEFPQFFNVLKGDMSVVGTRPPTPDEWEKYQYRHRARLSVQPGLTGLWQIQPNKDTMSFEEIVKLDTEYIAHWNIGTDLRIVLATAAKVIKSIFGHNKEEKKETASVS